jgi:hypothetical protein
MKFAPPDASIVRLARECRAGACGGREESVLHVFRAKARRLPNEAMIPADVDRFTDHLALLTCLVGFPIYWTLNYSASCLGASPKDCVRHADSGW